MNITCEIDGHTWHTTMLDFAKDRPDLTLREINAATHLLGMGYPAFVGGEGFPRATLHPMKVTGP